MVVYAMKYAAKQAQKEVPAYFENIGRFWGIYGNREVLAATMVFGLEKGKNTLFSAFQSDLREIINDAGSEIVLKRFGAGTVIIRFKNDIHLHRVEALFNRYGLKKHLSKDQIEFESPLVNSLPEQE